MARYLSISQERFFRCFDLYVTGRQIVGVYKDYLIFAIFGTIKHYRNTRDYSDEQWSINDSVVLDYHARFRKPPKKGKPKGKFRVVLPYGPKNGTFVHDFDSLLTAITLGFFGPHNCAYSTAYNGAVQYYVSQSYRSYTIELIAPYVELFVSIKDSTQVKYKGTLVYGKNFMIPLPLHFVPSH